MNIPVFKPTIRRRDMDAVLNTLVNDAIGPGIQNQNLGSKMQDFFQSEPVVLFREKRRAISTLFRSMNLTAGDKIILPALAPAVYLDSCEDLGIEPLIADVTPENACLSLESVESLLHRQPKAIVAVYTLGFIPPMESLIHLQIPIIEDVSDGIGASYGVRKAGSFGSFIIISLEEKSLITAGGGTAVVPKTRKESAGLKRETALLTDDVLLPDMNAALGLIQFCEIEKNIASRKEISSIFLQSLLKSHGYTSLSQTEESENVWASFPVIIKSGVKEIQQYAKRKDILTEPAFDCSIMSRIEPAGQQNYPGAQSLFLRCLLFPLYPSLGKKKIEIITRVLSTLP